MMRGPCIALRLIAAALALLASTVPAAAREKYAYGPPPEWERYKELGEAAIRAQLPNADNWIDERPHDYIAARWRGKNDGYLTCGFLRAAAPVPGWKPVTGFIVTIDRDQVKTVDIAGPGSDRQVQSFCAALIGSGKLPHARPAVERRDLAVASLGITARPMPEGAYVASVAAGSAAQRAGLAPGMVITRANGISLAGLGAAMGPLLGSPARRLMLETATGQVFTIEGPR